MGSLLFSLHGIRRILSRPESSKLIGDFVSMGLISRLDDVMRREKDPIIVLESIWIISCLTTNIVACRALDKMLAYPSIIGCLTHRRILITEKAVLAIGNLVSKRTETRDGLAEEV